MSGLSKEIEKLKNLGCGGWVWNMWAMMLGRFPLSRLDPAEEVSAIQNSNSSELASCEMTYTILLGETEQIPHLDTPAPFVLEATAQQPFAHLEFREYYHWAVPRAGTTLNYLQRQNRNQHD